MRSLWLCLACLAAVVSATPPPLSQQPTLSDYDDELYYGNFSACSRIVVFLNGQDDTPTVFCFV